jgi:acyl dehydratase
MSTDGVLSEGKITPEGLQKMTDLIQVELRRPFTFNTEITYDGARHFCWGIGDDNPLFLDRDYAAATAYGTPVAPQGVLYTTHPTYVQVGLPGVHGLHGGTHWKLFRPVPLGFEPRVTCWLDKIEEKPSQLGGGRSVWTYFKTVYGTPDGEVIAESTSYSMRTERSSGRKSGKEKREMKTWTEEELAPIEQEIVDHGRRGSEKRYFEDVAVGDTVDRLLKGPLCTTDMIAWYIGTAPAWQPAHAMALRHYRKHPKWAFRNPQLGVLEPNIRVHENMDAARSSGLAAPYDVGIQRHQWLFQALNDWAGDDGFVKECSAQFRGLNYFGDLSTITGTVVEKTVDDDGDSVVHLEMSTTNQIGQNTMPGTAVVALPTREGSEPVRKAASSSLNYDEYVAKLAPNLKPLPKAGR